MLAVLALLAAAAVGADAARFRSSSTASHRASSIAVDASRFRTGAKEASYSPEATYLIAQYFNSIPHSYRRAIYLCC